MQLYTNAINIKYNNMYIHVYVNTNIQININAINCKNNYLFNFFFLIR